MTIYGDDKAQVIVTNELAISYWYELDSGEPDSFECSMFCEIGEPYLPAFRRIFDEYSLKIETRDGSYGYRDYLVSENSDPILNKINPLGQEF